MPASTRSSRSCATRTRRSPPSRAAAPGTATTRSSRSSGRATAQPFEGGSSERMPLILGQERLIPGFEANLAGPRGRRHDRVRHHLPGRLPGGGAGRRSRRISRSSCASCARRSCPSSTTTSSGSLGDFADLDALRADIKTAARAERPRPGASWVRRPHHRVRRRQRDPRAPRHPGRPGGRGDARRVPRRRSPGRASPRRPTSRPSTRPMPTCTPSSGPGAEKRVADPARPVEGRRRRGRDRARRGGRRRGRPRSRALRRTTPSLLAYFDSRARPVVHPQHAAAQPGRRGPHRRMARRPSRARPAAAPRGRPRVRRRGRPGRRERVRRRDGPGLHPRRCPAAAG